MKKIITIILPLFLVPMLFSAESDMVPKVNDKVFDTETYTQLPGDNNTLRDTVIGDVIFEMDVQTITGCNRLLGIEFDGTYFYVTGACDPPGNSVYVIDTLGNLIWAPFQGTVTSWGWRDLAWDGVYAGPDRIDTLYASDGSTVVKFGIDLTSGVLTNYGSYPGPENPNRALAWMDDSLWFFTANFSNPCYKFSKSSSNLGSVANTWAMYGAAYDTDPVEGGWVWWHSQDNPGTGYLLTIHQFDPLAMAFTGYSFGYVPATLDSGMAGGLCFYEGFRGMDVLFALVQGYPVDAIEGIFVRYHDTGVEENPETQEPTVFGFVPGTQNPTKGNTAISYTTTMPGNVSLKVYDGSGRSIRTLVNSAEPAGKKTVYWDGKDDTRRNVPDGVYFLKLVANKNIDTQKLLVVR